MLHKATAATRKSFRKGEASVDLKYSKLPLFKYVSLWIGKQPPKCLEGKDRINNIYSYAISRQFYPKQLTMSSKYTFTFYQSLLFLVIKSMTLRLLAVYLSFRKD